MFPGKSFVSSESLQTVVKSDKGVTVTVSTELPSDQCAVCTVSGVNDTDTSCQSSFTLVPEEEVKLLFRCSEPVDKSYTVTFTQAIGEFILCTIASLITFLLSS